MKTTSYYRSFCSLVLALITMLSVTASVTAKETAAIALENSAQVEGQTLLLNGAGPLAVNRVKFYTVGIYLPAHSSTAPEVLALPGIVRIKIVMLKLVESETMSRRFISDIHANTSKEDRLKIASQMLTLGMGFGDIGDWNIGDVMTIDWLPGKGTVIRWNNKQVADVFKEPLLMQSILKIWIGDNVYDAKLKRLLLGEKE